MHFPFKRLSGNKQTLESCGRTDRGIVRQNNEDSFAVLQDRCLFMVADGLGGHLAGEVASAMAVEKTAMLCSPKELAARRGNHAAIQHFLIETFRAVNDQVSKAASREDQKGMGSTLTVAYVDRKTLHCCHVGDSRCYVIKGREISQITTDDVACLPGEDSDFSPLFGKCNALTRIIGYPLTADPQYAMVPLGKNDGILLCSDGLWSMVADAEILSIIRSSRDATQCCDRLIGAANAAGGYDNITAVVVFVR